MSLLLQLPIPPGVLEFVWLRCRVRRNGGRLCGLRQRGRRSARAPIGRRTERCAHARYDAQRGRRRLWIHVARRRGREPVARRTVSNGIELELEIELEISVVEDEASEAPLGHAAAQRARVQCARAPLALHIFRGLALKLGEHRLVQPRRAGRRRRTGHCHEVL